MRTVISFRITALSKPNNGSMKLMEKRFNDIFEETRSRNLLKVVAGLPKAYISEREGLKNFAQITWTCECPYEELEIFIETWNTIEAEQKVPFSPFTLRVGELLL